MQFNNPSQIIKDITVGKEGRDKIMSGVDQLANAVKSTLGASGKCVIYEDAMGNPVITKDGVTVAESVILWDPVENMGATMLKEAAKNTVKEAGDGTTTSVVIAQALMHAATEELEKREISLRELKKGINQGLLEVLAYLESIKIPVTDKMLEHVAAISCNNDPVLGGLIAEAFKGAGVNGEVLQEASDDEHTTVTTERGVQLPSGLKSQNWRTNYETDTAELEEPFVLIITSPLNTLRKIEQILEFCIKKNKPLLIIGELEQQPLATLLTNKIKGIVKVNVIDLPGFGKTKQDTIDDVAHMTGAKPVSEELGDDMDFMDISILGQIKRSVTNHKKTVLQPLDDIDSSERIKMVKKLIKKETNGYIKIKLEERLAILAGSVSVIKVGAESEIELKEKNDRIEDAIYAVKAAIKEGIVPGGGVALLNAAMQIEVAAPGANVLHKAIQAPFFAILENADTVLPDPVLAEIINKKGTGIDVVTGEIVDMVKRGIIDPVLVTKTALKNAVSVVSTIISADAILSNKRQN